MVKLLCCPTQTKCRIYHDEKVNLRIANLGTKVNWVYDRKSALILVNSQLVKLMKLIKI